MTGNGLQNPDLDFEQLYAQAQEAMPQLQDAGEKMLSDLRARHPGLFDSVQFEMGALKRADRAQAKITADYRGDASQISDLARGRLVVQTADQVAALRDYLTENADALGVEKTKDRFAVPSDTHFRDLNMKLRMPNGHVVELRVEQDALVKAAKQTHSPYAQIQDIERRAELEGRDMTADEISERGRLMDGIRDIHDVPSEQAGLNVLLDDKGRAKLSDHAAERAVREFGEAMPSSSSKVISLTEEFGRRAGVIGGLVVGGTLAATGASAQDIALGVAEAAVPGASSAIALTEGRPTEAGIRGIEEIPVAGIIASEIVRPIARSAGFDVDPSLGQMLLSRGGEINQEQKQFMAIFDALPAETTNGMSPEMASLVELKQAILAGEENVSRTASPEDRQQAFKDLDAVQNSYTQIYDSIAGNGKLSELAEEIVVHQRQVSPNPVAETAQPVQTAKQAFTLG